MEGVEEIPKAALDGTHESIARGGMEWSWETMLEFMDVVEKNDLALDVACYVPHGALRTYVMGPRGADHLSIPTDDDIKAMQMVVKQAVQAGALGVGSNRVGGHSDLSGNPVPGSFAPMNEIEALADAIREAGGGIFEFVTEGLMDETLRTAPAERAMFQRITTTEEDGGFVGTCFNFHPRRPQYNNSMLEWLASMQDMGKPCYGCVSTKSIAGYMSHASGRMPFNVSRTYRSLADLPHEEKMNELSDPEVRAMILDEIEDRGGLPIKMDAKDDHDYVGMLYPMIGDGVPQDWSHWACHEPQIKDSVAYRAKDAGISPAEYMYDLSLERGGHQAFYTPHINYMAGNLDYERDFIVHPGTLVSLADVGAHLTGQTDACNSTFILTHWVRDRERLSGRPGLTIEQAINEHCARPAAFVGMSDRGTIQVGKKADINVIDLDNLTIEYPEVVYDVPTGAKRWRQDVKGYDYTIIAGVITHKDNIPTHAYPGTLVRNPRTQHVRDAGLVGEIDLDFVLAQRSEAPRLLIGRGEGAPMLADVSKKYYKERLANSALVPPGTVAGLEMLDAAGTSKL